MSSLAEINHGSPSRRTQPALSTEARVGYAFFINSFVAKIGNIGARFAPLIAELAARNNDVSVFCRGGTAGENVRLETMGALGHVPRLLSAFRNYVAPSFPFRRYDIALFEWAFGGAAEEIARLDKQQPRLAHVGEYAPQLIDRLKEAGVPIVLDVPIAPVDYTARMRAEQPDFPLEPMMYMHERELACFEKADLILCPSPFVAETLSAAGVTASNMTIVPFGVDYDDWDKHGEFKSQGDTINFCFAGNIGTRKGIHDLLEAWSNPIFRRHRLHLCGRLFPDGRRALERYRFDNVMLPGFIDVQDYFKRCDVFVFPSLMEGSSKAIYEAMNRCLPVVTTYQSGSVVRDGMDGFIVPMRDPAALAQAMQRFLDEPELIHTMGTAAKAHMANYTWRHYTERVVAAYDQLLAS